MGIILGVCFILFYLLLQSLIHDNLTSTNIPDPPDSIRDEPIESISSMNIIDGACSLHNRKNVM